VYNDHINHGDADMKISKSQNLGNTFSGILAAAFPSVDARLIKVPAHMQSGRCGTVEVDGVGYDWFDRGDSYEFMVAA